MATLLSHLHQTLVSVHRRQRTFAVALRALFDLRPVGENEQAIAILGYVFPRTGDLQGTKNERRGVVTLPMDLKPLLLPCFTNLWPQG